MTTEPRQLVLDLALRPALGAEDFMISPTNATAVEIIDRWPEWPHWAVVVVGPAQSGKSHLANVWRFRSAAHAVSARDLDPSLAEAFKNARALVVENLEGGVNDEQMLFHLLNIAREHKLSILFTSRTAPGDLEIAFPDLRSRLRALPVVAIAPPDEMLLRAVLLKHFTDRQLTIDPPIISYLATHMERSFEAAQTLVEAIDRRSLATKRRVTRALASAVISDLSIAATAPGSAKN
jgi:chromosomal replication initiation ATPase DnaA